MKYPCATSGDDKWVIAIIRDGLRIWINLRDAHVSRGCLNDRYEPAETDFILSQLTKGDNFLDIGANIGWFTILAAHRVGATGRVIAFEPHSDINAALKNSVAENKFDDRVTVHRLALGAEAGEMELYGASLQTILEALTCLRQVWAVSTDTKQCRSRGSTTSLAFPKMSSL